MEGKLEKLFVKTIEDMGYKVVDKDKFISFVVSVMEDGEPHLSGDGNWTDWLRELVSSVPEEETGIKVVWSNENHEDRSEEK